MILIVHIHCLEGIYKILLDSSLDYLPSSMSLHCMLAFPIELLGGNASAADRKNVV